MSLKTQFAILCFAVLGNGCDGAEALSADTTQNVRAFPEHPLVTPSQATLHVGDTLRLSVRYPPGLFPLVHLPARWSSLSLVVATVDSATGLVTGRATGATTIVAALLSDPTVKGAMILQVVP